MARLWVLGAGTALPRPSSAGHSFGPAGHLFEPEAGGPLTLLDCGPGSVRQLGALGLGVERIQRVLLSHFHPDHCLDLFALLFARRNPALAGLPELEVIGPPGLERWAALTARGLGSWVEDPRTRYLELDHRAWGSGFERDGLWIRGRATGHTPHALALRLEVQRGPSPTVLAYSGDSGENQALVDVAREADLFLCECSFPDAAPRADHLTPSATGRLAREARAKRLVLTHFYPELDPAAARATAALAFEGPVEAAFDGACFEF